ncbi:IS5/IS1182 family transposase [Limnohabitans planktonicus II-D5]|uniref:IS5/IS1182 family transposase n=2 Tax=Limnohabitans planktonicus TaxID=540060 RepID=A0A2T7UIF9_9BURK|nr:IS5/IS1182 family transposase [Limnohabitans planktonicus II-D5]
MGVFEAHMSITADFFRNRLDQMIDLRHPLAVLANRMPWQEIEASLAHLFARQVRAGKKIEDSDLFGATEVIAGAGVSNAGRPRLPTRLMVALLYLKHAFNESDEDLIQRWGETPTWQYFSGNEYFEHRWPCDPTQLVKFRKLLGEEGVEELLARTVEVAVTLKLIAKKELSQIIVDSTVQEKAIAHPTDSKLLETARVKLVEAAKAQGIELKQTYAKEGQLLGYKAGRYAHARQFKRMRKAIKRQATIVGRLHREIARKMTTLSQAVQDALGVSIGKAKRLIAQSRSKKAQDKQPKLYSWHAPEVECISKGKSRNPYEFGVKVGIATTLQGTLIVGARAFPGNPYDGHTLSEQVEQASILMQALDTKPNKAIVDLGYRGVDKANPDIDIKHRGKFKSLTDEDKKDLKRRQAIEPIIGHLKADHRMNRCHLKGSLGDSLHAVLCAAGYNIRWLLRMIVKKGISLFLRLLLSTALGELGHRLRQFFMGPSVKSGSMNLTLV